MKESILFIHMFIFICQSMHVTNECVILFLASAKTGNTGIYIYIYIYTCIVQLYVFDLKTLDSTVP